MGLSNKYPRILYSGDCALTVEFGDSINESVNSQIRQFYDSIQNAKIKGITDLVPAFCSILVTYDPKYISYKDLTKVLEKNLNQTGDLKATKKKVVSIPVCYEEEFGPDLAFVAEHAGLTKEKVIEIHTSKAYLIYMLGFQPGFPYLGGLDERIFTHALVLQEP